MAKTKSKITPEIEDLLISLLDSPSPIDTIPDSKEYRRSVKRAKELGYVEEQDDLLCLAPRMKTWALLAKRTKAVHANVSRVSS